MRKATRKPARRVKPRKATVRKGAKAWTSDEVTKLRRAYRTKTATELARMLRRTVSSVKAKARALGLRKAKPARKAAPRRKPTTRRKITTRRRATTRRKATPKRKATRKKTTRRRR